MKRPFLRWALTETLFLAALAAGRLAYHGHIHRAGLVAIVAVIAVFLAASGWCGWLAWNETRVGVRHVDFAISLCPRLAMLGTITGFLIAFSGGVTDVQQRVAGASTGLAATFVGIAAMLVLELQRHLLDET